MTRWDCHADQGSSRNDKCVLDLPWRAQDPPSQAFETVSQLFSFDGAEKMAYSQLFLNLRGKIPPENHCFRPVFELRHSLIRRGSLPGRLCPIVS